MIRLESYAHSESQVRFKWAEGTGLEFPTGFGRPNFKQAGAFLKPHCVAQYSTGNFRKFSNFFYFVIFQADSKLLISCLYGYFSIEREIGFYWIYAFLPSIICVLLSWAGFWIKLTSAPARVTLGKTQMKIYLIYIS